MLITEKDIKIPRLNNDTDLLASIEDQVVKKFSYNDVPIRFVVSNLNQESISCEIGFISKDKNSRVSNIDSIFKLRKRPYENTNQFNVVLLIPTGLGCELGGHSGDGGALARLFASTCDNLITHPNVVNAADINEIPENALYVEGSIISRMLMGTVSLQKVRANRVILIIDEHRDEMFTELAINSVSAARVSLGLDCPFVIRLQTPAILRALFSSSGRAVGRIEHFDNICDVLDQYSEQFDAVALSTLINVPERFHLDYFHKDQHDAVNPWGGVEAMLTHAISSIYNIQSAHSPMMTSKEIMNLNVGVVDPRKAAEAVSTTYLHCIMKGLHNAPRVLQGQHPDNPSILDISDVSCVVIPDGCIGLPTLAALEQGIPVIAVKNRHCQMQNSLDSLPFRSNQLFFADNYLEAVGITMSLRSGICLDTVKRPVKNTVSVTQRGKSPQLLIDPIS